MTQLGRFLFACAWSVSLSSHAFCFSEASKKYGVDEKLLMAIAKVESNFAPTAINTNTNGSVDVGLMQINSQHFRALERFNITPQAVMEPCLNVHIGAWILAKMIKDHGATWRAVGAYNAGGKPDRESQRSVYALKVSNALEALSKKPPKLPSSQPVVVGYTMQVVE